MKELPVGSGGQIQRFIARDVLSVTQTSLHIQSHCSLLWAAMSQADGTLTVLISDEGALRLGSAP